MGNKAVINLATGLEDPERVTVAFLTAVAGAEMGGTVPLWQRIGDEAATTFSF
jgi:predicted peroxiredoxin